MKTLKLFVCATLLLLSACIEFLRFEEGSWMPELIQKTAHIAYEVDNLEEELKGAKVLVEPMPGGENLTIAFIEEEGIALELMYFEK